MADITMSLNDTLELDAVIEEWSNPDSVITDSDGQFNISGFQTNTGVLDPQNPGEHKIVVNGQELTVEVTDPSTIPDSAVIYLDSRNDATISTTSGNVDGWTDQVTGNELTGSAGSLGNINGNQSITFDASNSHQLNNTSFSDYSSPWTAFVVVDYNSNSSDATAWSDTNEDRPAMRNDSNDDWRFIRKASGGDLVGSKGTNVQLLTCINTSNGGFLRENGTQTEEGSQAGDTLSPLIIGKRNDEHWNGQIGFYELHNKELPDSELKNRENEIMTEWSI